MSPRSFGSVFSLVRSLRQSSGTTPARRQARALRRRPLAAESLESRAMLSTTATLSRDTSMFARIPVMHGTRGANPTASFVGQFSWSGLSGAAAAVGLPTPFKSFCVEGQQSISPGRHTFPTLKPLATSGLANAGLVEQFWRHYGPTTARGFTTATDAAAFQLGIWELISDGRPPQNAADFALAGGNFKVGGSTAPAVARAAAWLDAWPTGNSPPVSGGGTVSLFVLQHPTKQDQVVWVPAVDLDVDSDNTGVLDRSADEDGIEASTRLPGVIVPVGPDRVKMIADVPAGMTATLEFAQGVDMVRVYAQETWQPGQEGEPVLSKDKKTTTVVGGSPQTFWIEAFAPSDSMADIAFTLTLDVGTGSGSAGTGSTGSAPSDTIRATAVAVDLDVDSNNNDRLDTPKRDADEETKEATTPKRIVVNDNDTDDDDVPDYADWSIADKRFTPLVLEIPAGLPLGMMQIHVSYAASDPSWVGADHGLPANSGTRPLRIWTKNASQQRNPASITAGGSFVPEGRIEDLTTLGLTDSIRTVELYVEGIRATAGVSKPISVQLIVGGRLMTTDLVTVVVVSNTLVIGIDGTDSAEWLAKRDAKGNLINERTMPDGSTRWNSHVRNLVEDSWPFAMTYYTAGPDQRGLSDDSDAVFRRAEDAARKLIQDAGGGTTIALVGWSRGAMIASGVAHALLTLADGDLPRTVAFLGMYDPVDKSNGIPPAWATIHADVQAVTIIGPTADRQTEDAFNVDYDVQDGGWNNPHFVRMARGNRITTADGATTALKIIPYNASHGALGGTPGYNKRHRDGGEFPENYDYTLDVRDSIRADKDIRAGMRAAGLTFVPDRDAPWYRFPDERPPEHHRE